MTKMDDRMMALNVEALMRHPTAGSHVVEECGTVLGARVIRGLEMRFIGTVREARLVAAVLNWLETHKS